MLAFACLIELYCTPLQGTGEDDDDIESSSATLVQTEEGYAPVFFNPRALKNLVLVDEMPSLMPLIGEPQASSIGGHAIAQEQGAWLPVGLHDSSQTVTRTACSQRCMGLGVCTASC